MYMYQIVKIDRDDDRVRKVIKTFGSKEEAITYLEKELWVERENELVIYNRIWDWYDDYDGSTYYIRKVKKRP